MKEFDSKNLIELSEIGGKELVFDLIHLFCDEAGVVVQKIQMLKDENKENQIGPIAHKLKSSAGSLGLHVLHSLCQAIDAKCSTQVKIEENELSSLIKQINLGRELLLDYKKSLS